MTTTPTMKFKLSTYGRQDDNFWGSGSELQLDIWQDDNGKLLIRVMRDGSMLATKTFLDGETQHTDSERWLNDEVGFPNPFAGILAHPEVWS